MMSVTEFVHRQMNERIKVQKKKEPYDFPHFLCLSLTVSFHCFCKTDFMLIGSILNFTADDVTSSFTASAFLSAAALTDAEVSDFYSVTL